jgi:hypothetical protein
MADASQPSPRKSKTAKAKKSTYEGPVTFHYANYINYTEVASILIDKMGRFLIASPEMALEYGSPEDLDPIKFGEELSRLVEPSQVHELMGSEMAQGVMLGMYLMKMQQQEIDQMIAEEEEALDGSNS